MKLLEGGAPLPQVTWTWFGAVAVAVPIAGAPGGVQRMSVTLAVQISSRRALRRSVQDGQKMPASQDDLAQTVRRTLDEIQKDLYQKAVEFREKHSYPVDDFSKFNEILDGDAGFLWSHWCGSDECEDRVKAETKATIRCIPMNRPKETGKCIVCGGTSEGRVIFARAY